MQFDRILQTGPRQRASIAASVTRAIIGTNPSEACYLGLYLPPLDQDIAPTALKNDGGTATSRAVDFETVTAHIHKPARLRRTAGVHAASNLLVRLANRRQYQDTNEDR